jgi:hypothetical protein
VTVKWHFYPACDTCKAGPGKPCPGRFGNRVAPHTGRRRRSTDQTPPPVPPVRKPCTATHPDFGWQCSREVHVGETHVHAELGIVELWTGSR